MVKEIYDFKISSNGTRVVISERNTQNPVDQENGNDRPCHNIQDLLVLHCDQLFVKGQRTVDDHNTKYAKARTCVKANTALEIHKVIAVVPKHGKGRAEKLNDIRCRKLDHGRNQAYVNEQQKESDIQLTDVERLFDLLMENTVDQHTAKAVNGKPRSKEKTSVRPDAIVKIRPDHLVDPSAHSEKDKQQ